MNIINVGYKSTNYYILDTGKNKLLVDCGWPGTLSEFTAVLKRKGLSVKDIQYFLVTHFHPDHAGLTEDLKKLGVKHLLFDVQVGFSAQLNEHFKAKNFPGAEINENNSTLLKVEESRAFLSRIGIQGEIIHTPGHSDDSVTLILDEGFAFVGDLHPRFVLQEDDMVSRSSWDKIYTHKIQRIYPAHGG
jgi:glyoxylase-like metal-dependent hydrolase (beta-lactamase superfamily II)